MLLNPIGFLAIAELQMNIRITIIVNIFMCLTIKVSGSMKRSEIESTPPFCWIILLRVNILSQFQIYSNLYLK